MKMFSYTAMHFLLNTVIFIAVIERVACSCQTGYFSSEGFCLPAVLQTSRVVRFTTGEDVSLEASPSHFGYHFENTLTINGHVTFARPVTGCVELENSNQMYGRIAVIDRGSCTFETKALAAVRAGAVAVVITEVSASNSEVSRLYPDECLKETDVSIPVVYLKLTNAQYFKKRLALNTHMTISITSRGSRLGERCTDSKDCMGFPAAHICDSGGTCVCHTPTFTAEGNRCVINDMNTLVSVTQRDHKTCSVVPVGSKGCLVGTVGCTQMLLSTCKDQKCVCVAGYKMVGTAGTSSASCKMYMRQRTWTKFSPGSSTGTLLTSSVTVSKIKCASLCLSNQNCGSFEYSRSTKNCRLVWKNADHTLSSNAPGSGWTFYRDA